MLSKVGLRNEHPRLCTGELYGAVHCRNLLTLQPFFPAVTSLCRSLGLGCFQVRKSAMPPTAVRRLSAVGPFSSNKQHFTASAFIITHTALSLFCRIYIYIYIYLMMPGCSTSRK